MIVVTGAGGFVGIYLIDNLKKLGYSVIAVDKDNKCRDFFKKIEVPFYKIDITNRSQFKKISTVKIDTIIDLACMQPANIEKEAYNPTEYIQTNVIGRLNTLEFARIQHIKKYIYTTSHRNTAGLWGKNIPINETMGISIKYTGEYALYSISETAAIDCVTHYSQEYGIQGIILRFPPIYGYGPHTEIYKNGIPILTGFKRFIENAKEGITIEIWGNAKSGRDIIYVKDVVSAIIKCIKSKNANGVYNIASGYRLSLDEEVKEIINIFCKKGNRSRIIYNPSKPNSLDFYVYDISKAKRELKWAPKYNFKMMLIDYKKESESNRFKCLINKRRLMFHQNQRYQ